MPLSTVLPPPDVEFLQELFFPVLSGDLGSLDTFEGDAAALPFGNGVGIRPAWARTSVVSAPRVSTDPQEGAFLPAGAVREYAPRLGRAAVRYSMAGNPGAVGAACVLPFSIPPYESAGQVSGAFSPDDSVVSVWDFHLTTDVSGTPGWLDDTSPIVFLPKAVGSRVDETPGNGPSTGGFGCFLNDDGAGGARYEYVAWDDSGAVLERVQVPASVIGDIQKWSTFRWIIVGATAGRAAFLELEVNGTPIVTGREFGSSVLQTPEAMAALTSSGTAASLIGGTAANGPGSSSLWMSAHIKVGRFKPSGTQEQSA